MEAIKELSSLMGLSLPERANTKEWEEYRLRQDSILASYERQKEALFTPEGAKVLQYLKEVRGYSEEFIKSTPLGFIFRSIDKEASKENRYRNNSNLIRG